VDEPGSCLDIANQSAMFNMVKEVNKTLGTTILMAGHEVNLLGRVCDKIIGLVEGKAICFDVPYNVITRHNLRRIFDADFEIIDRDQDTPLAVCNG